MRLYAIVLIVALVASAQCISACAIASCTEAQQRHIPPCHQHGAPQGGIPTSSHHHGPNSPGDLPHDKACDHQKTADEARWAALDLYFFDVLTVAPSIQTLTTDGVAEVTGVFESPPPLAVPSSVLRI